MAIILIGPLGAISFVLLCKASHPLIEALVVTVSPKNVNTFNGSMHSSAKSSGMFRIFVRMVTDTPGVQKSMNATDKETARQQIEYIPISLPETIRLLFLLP